MTLYVVIGAFMAAGAIAWWFFSTGRKDAQADQMAQVNSDAILATRIKEQVEAMSSDGVRAQLLDRMRKQK